jgi:hypothetical protein
VAGRDLRRCSGHSCVAAEVQQPQTYGLQCSLSHSRLDGSERDAPALAQFVLAYESGKRVRAGTGQPMSSLQPV